MVPMQQDRLLAQLFAQIQVIFYLRQFCLEKLKCFKILVNFIVIVTVSISRSAVGSRQCSGTAAKLAFVIEEQWPWLLMAS